MSVKAWAKLWSPEVVLLVIASCCLLWELDHVSAWLRVVTLDASSCYVPWYGALLHAGRFRGISGAYANYTPPTLYLFSLASFFQGHHTPAILLKLINVPFVLASGALTYVLGRTLGSGRLRSASVCVLVMVLPEVWENAFHWGQYDVVFTVFLMGGALALVRGSWRVGMFLFGSALAFKLQAFFAAPVILGLLLAGNVPLSACLFVPLGYVVWMAPAAFAGRSWHELLTIYLHQYETYPNLSVDAPNFYLMVQKNLIDPHVLAWALKLATLAAVGALCWVAFRVLTFPAVLRMGEALIFAFAVSQLTAAYLLPRMHERYFFAGGVFATLLLLTRMNALLPVVLLQVSAVGTYHQYFRHAGYDTSRSLYVLPFICLTGAMILLWVRFAADPVRIRPVVRLRW